MDIETIDSLKRYRTPEGMAIVGVASRANVHRPGTRVYTAFFVEQDEDGSIASNLLPSPLKGVTEISRDTAFAMAEQEGHGLELNGCRCVPGGAGAQVGLPGTMRFVNAPDYHGQLIRESRSQTQFGVCTVKLGEWEHGQGELQIRSAPGLELAILRETFNGRAQEWVAARCFGVDAEAKMAEYIENFRHELRWLGAPAASLADPRSYRVAVNGGGGLVGCYA